MKNSFTHFPMFVLAGFTLFTNGCAIADSQAPTHSNSSVVYTTSSQDKDAGYMYNRTNNLEYMDTKSIEKYKKAVAILIDKVDAMEAKVNEKYDSQKINLEISSLKNEIGSIKNSTGQNQTTETMTDEDIKILQFINNDERLSK